MGLSLPCEVVYLGPVTLRTGVGITRRRLVYQLELSCEQSCSLASVKVWSVVVCVGLVSGDVGD